MARDSVHTYIKVTIHDSKGRQMESQKEIVQKQKLLLEDVLKGFNQVYEDADVDNSLKN